MTAHHAAVVATHRVVATAGAAAMVNRGLDGEIGKEAGGSGGGRDGARSGPSRLFCRCGHEMWNDALVISVQQFLWMNQLGLCHPFMNLFINLLID